MKKGIIFIALAVSSYVLADVDLSVTVRRGEYSSNEKCTLSSAEPTYTYTSCCGAQLNIVLQEELENEVVLGIECSKDGNTVSESVVRSSYNQESRVACTSEKVDAEIIITATKSEN